MTEFEQYIKEKASKINMDPVDPALWDSIEKELGVRKKHTINQILSIAASVLILVATSIILKNTLSPSKSIHEGFIASNNTELQSLEADLRMDIDQRIAMLKTWNIPLSLKSNFKFLIDEFYNLDFDFPMTGKDTFMPANDQMLQEQLVNHYTMKRKILERIEQEILKINKIQKDNHNESKKILLPL
jgi:hypothetical protein